MNICMLATSYPRHEADHASVFVHGLAKGLCRAGCSITAVVPHEEGLALSECIEGVEIRRFRYFWPLTYQQVAYGFGIPDNVRRKIWAKIGLPFFILFFFLKAWKESRNADLLHVHWEISALVGIPIARLRGIPIVYTVHRLVARSALGRFLTKRLLRSMSELHVNSSYTERLAADLAGKELPIHRIYPSIDADRFTPAKSSINRWKEKWNLPPDTRILLGLGRLIEKKGFSNLLEAYHRLCQLGAGAKTFLVIAGGGPLEETLRRQADSYPERSQIGFTGFLSPADVHSLYQEAAVFVVPSILDRNGEIETLGTVSMEAMACQVPVIASDIGGVADVVQSEQNGLLVPSGNIDELVRAITRILQDMDLRLRLGVRARESVLERFTWNTAAAATQSRYENLLRSA